MLPYSVGINSLSNFPAKPAIVSEFKLTISLCCSNKADIF